MIKSHTHWIYGVLKIKTKTDKAGNLITPVEMIFGEIFEPSALQGEFFLKLKIYRKMICLSGFN